MKTLLLMVALAGGAQAAIPEGYAERLADAIWLAEGGKKAKSPYGVLSVKTKDPRGVCLHTIRNNWTRWETAGKPGDFIDFLGKKYAPVGAKNDPRGAEQKLA